MAEKIISAPDPEFEEIKEKFFNGAYSTMQQMPCALCLWDGKIYHIGKNVRHHNLLKSLQSVDSIEETPSQKLQVKFYCLSSLFIHMINAKCFFTREQFDKLCHDEWNLNDFEQSNVKKLNEISFQGALSTYFNCKISCNMEHYFAHKDEMEQDLNERLSNSQLKEKNSLKVLQARLLFKLLQDTFGDEKDEKEQKEQTIILRDFRLVLDMHGFKVATAERGDFYIAFFYILN